MTKVAIRRLDSVTHNDTAATSLINDNFNSIQEALENTLSRDGTTPNFMDAELDMNGRRIINGGEAVEDTDYVTYGQIKEDIAGAARASMEAAASAAKADVSAQSASISAQTAIAATREAQEIKDYVDKAVLDENLITVAEDLKKGEDSEIVKLNSNKENIDTVADAIDNVNTVSSNIADVNTVADDIESVKDVAANRTNIDTVAGSVAAVAGVAAITAAVVAVNANKDNINAVNANEANINAVAGVAGDVSTVAGIADSVTAVASNEEDIKAVAANRDNIVTVASSASDINQVSSNIDSVNKVAEDLMDVMTVAGISTQVQSVADNMSAVIGVNSVKDSVKIAADNVDAIKEAADNIEDIKEAANAKIWAEGTDPEVTGIGGTHSAKGWAELAGQLVGVGPATEDTIGLVKLATIAEAKEGFDDSSAMTPLKTAQVVYDNVGRGIQLGFHATLEDGVLTFEVPDPEPYTIKHNYDYEIDLLFEAVGELDDSTPMVIKNGQDTINIVNVMHDDFTKSITVGEMKQIMKYSTNIGWRWIFMARFAITPTGERVFVMPSTVVSIDAVETISNDTIYNKLHDALIANPDMIRYENDTSMVKILAGSTFVFPNGDSFDKVTLENSIQTMVFPDHEQIIFTNGTQLFYIDEANTFAGPTAPTAYSMMLWYDTTAKRIKYTGNNGETWTEGYAFPFGYANNEGITKCFCNGIGYFANCSWILDGVEVLIPNDKNKDGTFNNIKYTVKRPLVTVFDDTREGEWALGPSGITVAAQGFELSEQNNVINKQTGAVVNGCPMGKFKTVTGRIETMEVRSILDLTVAESAKGGTGASAAFNLFDTKWTDHLQNDASWLRADTFSWQSGDIYTAAYNELLEEFNGTTSTSTDTIEGIDIVFKRTAKGYKIVDASQETAVASIFDKTGVAWYYILDVANKRFKLPRNKYSFRGVETSAGNYFKGSVPDHTHYMYVANNYNGTTNNAGGNGTTNTVTQTNAVGGVYNNDTYQSGAAVQSRSVECYLYFYVGNTVRNITEINVGSLTEIVNNLDVTEAVTEITSAKNSAVNAITTASNTNVSDVNSAGMSVLTNIDAAKTSSVSEINNTKNVAVTEISSAGEAIANYQQPITTLTATSGTIALEVSKIYTMSVTGATTFTLPAPAVKSVFNQIKVMMKVTGTPAINWGTTQFFNKAAPEIEAGSYDAYFDYDNLLEAWVVGVMPKGAAE